MKQSIASISPDKRMQSLLIAFSSNAFLEGAAGFGAPVAITAVILVGLGFSPLSTASICLVSNITGGTYGAMEIPVIVSTDLTNIPTLSADQHTALILSIVTGLISFLIIYMVDGFRGIKDTLPAILVSGGAFPLTQFMLLYFIGPKLVDVASAIISLLALIVFFKILAT